MLAKLIGQQYAVKVLQNYLEEGHISGSFLFVGPPHVGKATCALEFAKAILCENPQPDLDACDHCFSCRAADAGGHPDIRSVQPVGPSRILRMPQIWPRDGVKDFPAENALLHDLQYAPVRGKRRIFIIEDADTLNGDTANSILKVLEEPPDYATFILTAPGPGSVLPTIFSRCQTVRFGHVPDALTIQALRERDLADESTAKFIAAYAQGKIGMAFDLAQDQDLRTARAAILLIAKQISTSRMPIHALRLADDLRKAASKLTMTKKDAADADTGARAASVAGLELLAYWYRDLLSLCAQTTGTELINADFAADLMDSLSGYDIRTLTQAIEFILSMRDCIKRNANGQVGFEALTLRLITLRRSPAHARA